MEQESYEETDSVSESEFFEAVEAIIEDAPSSGATDDRTPRERVCPMPLSAAWDEDTEKLHRLEDIKV